MSGKHEFWNAQFPRSAISRERKSACVPDFLQVVSNSHDFVILSRVEEFFEQRPCAAGALARSL